MFLFHPQGTSSQTSTSSSSEEFQDKDHKPKITNKIEFYDYHNKAFESKTNFENQREINFNNVTMHQNNSLCSMNCLSRRFDKQDFKRRKSPILFRQRSPNISLGSTDAEKHMISTDLDLHSLRSTDPEITASLKPAIPVSYNYSKTNVDKQKLLFDKLQATHAYYFFTRKRTRCASPDAQMKRSKKSTNLVKYRNFLNEPMLKKPLSRCMLLKNCSLKTSQPLDLDKNQKPVSRNNLSGKESNEVQVAFCDNETITKSSLDAVTLSECDNITQKLMISLFHNKYSEKSIETKQYLKQVIRELYDVNVNCDPHPIRELFRGLLDFWLSYNSKESVHNRNTQSQSIDRQSNKHFTRDQNISSLSVNTVNRETQFHGISDVFMQYQHRKVNTSARRISKITETKKKQPPVCQSPKRDTESFEKERRIQELERILKNTVYIVDTSGKSKSKEKDIKITKTLIDNIGKLSRRSEINKSPEPRKDNSNSSTEKMQETINHLISETAIPADVAKEFLSAYLDVLLHGDSSMTNTSSQSSTRSTCKTDPKCDVVTEAITKKVSKSVTNLKRDCDKPSVEIDPGQLYLKDILDKVTTIFSRVTKVEEKSWDSDKSQHEIQVGDGKPEKPKDKISVPGKDYPGNTLIYENIDENSVVIDLTKYNLEHVSVASDPNTTGLMTITIKLKEKADLSDAKRTQLELKFSESRRLVNDAGNDDWLDYISPNDTTSNELFNKKIPKPNSFLDFPNEFDLKPYLSSSDVTTKAYHVSHESEHTLDLSFNSSNAFHKDFYENEDEQSCYIMSFKNGALATKFQSKKKIKIKERNGVVISPKVESRRALPTKPSQLTVFQRPAPRVIDEKFILLLLENLTLLSKNIPSLHKEINALYIKLKKKHEKVVKTCGNIQGVSLLGKIYNEDSCTSNTREAATQCESTSNTNIRNTKDVSTNTSAVIITRARMTHQNLSAIDFKNVKHTASQTEGHIEIRRDSEVMPKSLKDLSSHMFIEQAITNCRHEMTTEHATSNPNWIKNPTRDREVSTIIKCIIDANTTHNHNFYVENKIDKDMKKRKLQERKDFLSPLAKVSRQSQTEKKCVKVYRDRTAEREFKIYQLFMSRRFTDVKSNSLSDYKMEAKLSDDLKTLYRCTSDPSIVSS